MHPDPLSHEKRMAAVMHLCSIPAPFISPLIGLALYRKSRYVCAHSFQALYEAIFLKVAFAVAAIVSLTYTIVTLWNHYQTDWVDWSWTNFLLRIAVGWAIVFLIGIATTIQGVIAAIRANSGKWPRNGRVQQALLQRFDDRR